MKHAIHADVLLVRYGDGHDFAQPLQFEYFRYDAAREAKIRDVLMAVEDGVDVSETVLDVKTRVVDSKWSSKTKHQWTQLRDQLVASASTGHWRMLARDGQGGPAPTSADAEVIAGKILEIDLRRKA